MNVVSLTQQTSHGVISEQTPAAFRRTPKGRRQAESRHSCMALYNRQQVTFIRNGMTRVSFPAFHLPTVRDSRTLHKLPASQTNKNFPHVPAISKKRIKFSLRKWRGYGGSSGRVREVWREREPSPKEGSLSLQGLSLPLQGLPYPSTASFSNPARLILCEAFFGNSSATGTKRTIRL